jgi:arabinofuranosyltransferase
MVIPVGDEMVNSLKKWLPVLLIILALGARLVPGTRTIDDSYITFRYARNLLSGEGFVYNPGEHVLGTTTPLYTLLMAGLGALSGGTQAPFPWLALGVNALTDAITCLLLWQLGKHLKAEWAGLTVAILWAVEPYSVTFAIGGLETSLYVMLLTATILAYVKGKKEWAAISASLALVTRPDALILVGPLLIDRAWRAWRRKETIRIKEVMLFVVPSLAWGIFATLYFGSPIPHSVQAKTAAYQLSSNEGLIRLIQHYAAIFHQNYYLGAVGIGIGLVLFPFLYAVGARRALRNEPRLLVYVIYPWLYFALFAIANPLIFRWYLTPPIPPYFFFIILGADELLAALFRKKMGTQSAWRLWLPAGLVLVLPVASVLSAWQLHPDHGPNRPAPEMAFIKLELLYQQAAEEILPQLKPGDVLAAGDVGVLGYATDARILDTVGLNSPQTIRYYPLDKSSYVSNYAIPADLILNEQPDWLVFLEIYGRNTLGVNAAFQQNYIFVDDLPTDIYDSNGMLIYRRAISGVG